MAHRRSGIPPLVPAPTRSDAPLTQVGQTCDPLTGSSAMRSQVMSVRAKLGLSFALLALLVVAICLLALNALDSTNKELGRFVDGVNARALLAAQVRTAVDRRAIAARNLVLVTSDA